MSQVARSSGLITADTLVHSGRCKLVSIHGYNFHADTFEVVTIYDNTAASGKVVAKILMPPKTSNSGGPSEAPTITSLEWDMHGVICENGLYVDCSMTGVPNLTIEYA